MKNFHASRFGNVNVTNTFGVIMQLRDTALPLSSWRDVFFILFLFPSARHRGTINFSQKCPLYSHIGAAYFLMHAQNITIEQQKKKEKVLVSYTRDMNKRKGERYLMDR